MLVVQLIWSVLVLITMLVTHQPACLNPFTISYPRAPWPPYTTTRPLIPELGVPESEATIGWGLQPIRTHICWSQLTGGCCYWYNLWESSGKGNYNSKIIKENILVSISIDFITILKSKLPSPVWHPKCFFIIQTSHSLLDSFLTPHSHSLPYCLSCRCRDF